MKNLLLLFVSAIISIAPIPGLQAKAFSSITNNTITADQTICQGSIPAGLTGSIPGGGTGTYTYQWQMSTTSATAGFSDISGETNQNYTPTSWLTETTWYQRIVYSGTRK